MLKFFTKQWYLTRGFITGVIVTAATVILTVPLLILAACGKAETEKETK